MSPVADTTSPTITPTTTVEATTELAVPSETVVPAVTLTTAAARVITAPPRRTTVPARVVQATATVTTPRATVPVRPAVPAPAPGPAPVAPVPPVAPLPPAPKPPVPTGGVGNGTREVGVDMAAGRYKTPGPASSDILDSCYWSRSRDDSGSPDTIIANDNITGPGSVTVLAHEFVKFAGGCVWTKQ